MCVCVCVGGVVRGVCVEGRVAGGGGECECVCVGGEVRK